MDRATATGTSSARTRAALLAAALVVAAAIAAVSVGGGSGASAFAWLRPAPAPAGWHPARTPGGATFAYPPGWRAIETDPGTASAALVKRGLIAGYLNATPRDGGETLANWSRFRPAHDREEGDRDVRLLSSASGLRFRAGHGSCVIDRYSTSRTTYCEIACLVAGPHRSTVIVAAAPDSLWGRQAPTLERAVSTFTP